MPTITVIFDPALLPVGAPASINFTADPAAVTLKVKNDTICFFNHPSTNDDEVVTQVNTILPSGKFSVLFTPFDTTHPPVTPKSYSVRSSALPHEDLLTQTRQGNNLLVEAGAPTTTGKTTTYSLATTAPPFLTIKVKRQ
jgi:hypothetical protein